MVRKRSWPAVSHYSKRTGVSVTATNGAFERIGDKGQLTICSFTVFPSSSIVRIFCHPSSVGGRWAVWNGSTYEIDTNGGDVGLSVGVIGESQKQARLSNTGVTDEEELEEVVVPVDGLVSTWRREERYRCMAIEVFAREGRRRREFGMDEGTLQREIVSLMSAPKGFVDPSQGGDRGNVLLGVHCDKRRWSKDWQRSESVAIGGRRGD